MKLLKHYSNLNQFWLSLIGQQISLFIWQANIIALNYHIKHVGYKLKNRELNKTFPNGWVLFYREEIPRDRRMNYEDKFSIFP